MVGDFIVTDQPLYVNKQDKAHKIDGGFLTGFNFRLMSDSYMKDKETASPRGSSADF
jgi:hypothetical protein